MVSDKKISEESWTPWNTVSSNVAVIGKQYDAEVILNEIVAIGHGHNTNCKANKSCDEIMDENTEYTKHLGFKITEKEKTLPIMHWILKMRKESKRSTFHYCIWNMLYKTNSEICFQCI